MLNKLCNAIGSTIQIKKSFLQELMRNVDQQLLKKQKDGGKIEQEDFISLMGFAFKELNERLADLTGKCDVLSMQMSPNRIPDYLQPGNLFLG